MRVLRVALAQVNPTVGDLDGNTQAVLRGIDQARAQGADLVAFPELCITGYPPEDLLFKPSFIAGARERLERVVAASQGLTVVVGFPEGDGSDLYNAAAVIHDGALVDVYRKIFLPTYSVFDEDRYFRRGDRCPVYRIGDAAVGVNVCEDMWYAVGPTSVQRAAGAEVIININGSPFYRGKHGVREKMLATRASDNGLYVCYVNMVGGQDELVFDGGSLVVGPHGDIIARGAQFAEDMVVVDLDLDAVFSARLHDPRWRKLAAEEAFPEWGHGEAIEVAPVTGRRERPPLSPRPAVEPLSALGETYQALVLGTRDYVRKSGFSKVVIGLSGGIDSTLTATVATDALGPENVVGVAMPSQFSSEGSVRDAALLARNLGIELMTVPIASTFRAYEEMLSEAFAGREFDVTEENIQARIRGNVLMALSNKFGWLVLATGDKSEYATGFTTLYGDMAGGFAVIKDVPKTLAYALSQHRNESAGHEVIPQAILDKAPSPELRPNQLATDTLPPYPLLDPVLEGYVEQDRSPQDLVAMGHDPKVVELAVRMVDRSEYKRRQAPPGVKISPRAFGRDRRLPIVNRFRPL